MKRKQFEVLVYELGILADAMQRQAVVMERSDKRIEDELEAMRKRQEERAAMIKNLFGQGTDVVQNGDEMLVLDPDGDITKH